MHLTIIKFGWRQNDAILINYTKTKKTIAFISVIHTAHVERGDNIKCITYTLPPPIFLLFSHFDFCLRVNVALITNK